MSRVLVSVQAVDARLTSNFHLLRTQAGFEYPDNQNCQFLNSITKAAPNNSRLGSHIVSCLTIHMPNFKSRHLTVLLLCLVKKGLGVRISKIGLSIGVTGSVQLVHIVTFPAITLTLDVSSTSLNL